MARDAKSNKPKSQAIEIMKRLAKNKLAMLGLVVIVLMILVAVFAPWIAPTDLRNRTWRPCICHPARNTFWERTSLGGTF